MQNIVENLLNLSDTKIVNTEIISGEVLITVVSTIDDIPCRQCGKPTVSKGVGQEVKLRHLPILGQPCYILIKPKRGYCKNCEDNPTTNQRLSWYDYKSRYTKDYEHHILFSLINSTITDVSIKENIGYGAVEGIVERRIENKVNWNQFKALGLVGIDEIALKKRYRDYVTIITSRLDGKNKVLAVIKGRDKADIKRFLEGVPKRLHRTIAGFCCDMHDGYVYAVKEVFKEKIPVIVDRFHVAKLYRKSLIALRKSELKRLKKELKSEIYQSLKQAISILKVNKEFLSNEERKVLEKLFKYSPALKTAYRLCCKLTGIYNSRIGIRKATKKIDEWIALVEASGLNCFNTFIATLRKYKTQIVRYFKGRFTSGFVEGLNNKIKVIKRRCYGILNENTLFQRLFLDLSGYDLALAQQGLLAI